MAADQLSADLLELWVPPKIVSEEINPTIIPIGFIATSFRFDSDFFDDECITRFLSMETEKEEDGAAFLIEREEKLAGLLGGIVLIDQHHCRGPRSLRWDLIPCRVRNGIMHAKITVLHWSHCIRLIVGSANLTQPGYCINQEVVSVFDYYPGSEEDPRLIQDNLIFLEQLAKKQCGRVVQQRFDRMIREIRKTLAKWEIADRRYKGDEIAVSTLFISPAQKDGLQNIRAIWDERFNSPPDQVTITSPFFDCTPTPYTPSKKLPGILRQKGLVDISYQVTTDGHTDIEDQLVLNAPDFIKHAEASNCQVFFYMVEEKGVNEKNKEVPRPLHLKSLWLNNAESHLLMIGSSNFTSAGLGQGPRVNYEANIVYTVNSSRNPKAYKLLVNAHLEGVDLPSDDIRFQQRSNEDEVLEEDVVLVLPGFFGEAIIKRAGQQHILELNFCSGDADVPADFIIGYEKLHVFHEIFNEAKWIESGKKLLVEIEWNDRHIPDHLSISWAGLSTYAFWPVVIESQLSLPPVEQLRELSLESLIYILSSSQPLYRLIDIIEKIRSREKNCDENENNFLDAHKLVDTSGFLLQRTRRISYAIKALAERLSKPVFTVESLQWRLSGPVGVQSLIDAISREAKSDEEKEFLLAELALELSRIKFKTTQASLKENKVRMHIKKVIEGLAADVARTEIKESVVSRYSIKAINKALNEF